MLLQNHTHLKHFTDIPRRHMVVRDVIVVNVDANGIKRKTDVSQSRQTVAVATLLLFLCSATNSWSQVSLQRL